MPRNQGIRYLPQEILIEIFLLLPYDSIRACKLVSKEWNKATHDPTLVYRLITSVAFFRFNDMIYCVSPKKIHGGSDPHPPITVDHIPIDLNPKQNNPLLWESRKGIACVVSFPLHRLLFYKLLTGDPQVITADLPVDKYCLLYGFGYDCYADDCKTMMAFNPRSPADNSLFWVYSLRNRTWSSLQGFPYAIADEWPPLQPLPCPFNGILHWIIRKRGQASCVIILTYDLHTSRFGEMSLPITTYNWDATVAELGGRLCYWYRRGPYRPTPHCILSVWTMREYGVSESWTSLYTIDLQNLSQVRFKVEIEPTSILYNCRNGGKLTLFVCKYHGTLYWYDIDNHRVITSIQKNFWEKTTST